MGNFFSTWRRGGGEAYITVGEPHDKSVLGGIVLVLRLSDQPLTGIVVGLSLTSTTVFCLVAGVVGFGLDDLCERLYNLQEPRSATGIDDIGSISSKRRYKPW